MSATSYYPYLNFHLLFRAKKLKVEDEDIPDIN